MLCKLESMQVLVCVLIMGESYSARHEKHGFLLGGHVKLNDSIWGM